MPAAIIIELVTFSIVTWLGFYLLSRSARNPLTAGAGSGAVAYGIILGLFFFSSQAGAPDFLNRLSWSLLVFPAYFWSVSLIYLERNGSEDESIGKPSFLRTGLPATLIAALLLYSLPVFWDQGTARPSSAGLFLLSLSFALPLAAGLYSLARISKSEAAAFVGVRAALVVTLFFTLGSGLLLFPLSIIDPAWLHIAVAGDFALLAVVIARLDAFNLGERLLADFFRSLTFSMGLAALFGGQVGFIIAISTGPTLPMLALLHLTIFAALFVSVFTDELQYLLEKRLPDRGQPANFNYRAVARAAIKMHPGSTPSGLDEKGFYRQTRRALSDFGNLPKLVTNPLIYLDAVSARLNAHGLPDSPLDRARVLKTILTAAVMRLKPTGAKLIDETEEWRFFNSLYYPYILGLKPYRRRATYSDLDENSRQALNWFNSTVPERTLYNWQQAAANLVAQQLRNPYDETT